MRAGELRQRVTLLEPVAGVDTVGQPRSDWVERAQLWANVSLLSGLETVRADSQTPVVKASIRMRYGAPIDESMRLRYGGITYAIKAVLPDPNRVHVDFVCESVK
jgi:SPP1 family predicted phage head-tail adaptor